MACRNWGIIVPVWLAVFGHEGSYCSKQNTGIHVRWDLARLQHNGVSTGKRSEDSDNIFQGWSLPQPSIWSSGRRVSPVVGARVGWLGVLRGRWSFLF